MTDNSFWFLFLVSLAFKLFVPIAVIAGVVIAISRATKRGASTGLPVAGGLDGFAQQLQLMQQIVAQARAAQTRFPGSGAGVDVSALPPELQLKFSAAAQRAEREMQSIADTRRAMAETRMAGLMSDAISAGIDVSSWK
jgi:hypothetical protein